MGIVLKSCAAWNRTASNPENMKKKYGSNVGKGDTGGASRFFYTAKSSKAERNGVKHPTVKPIDLMRYLCRLITPPNGLILDPFMGSGSTLIAAYQEDFFSIGIEFDPNNFQEAEQRIKKLTSQTKLDFK